MKIALIVTEFPSTTETFIARDAVKFLAHGHDVRIYHLLPFDRKAVLHDFAAPLAERARYFPFFGAGTIRSLWSALRSSPGRLGGILGAIFRGCWREPSTLLKSLAIVPKSVAMADDLRAWGADHVHGEFAGHPATSAWIVRRLIGLGYSVSCRAHDIFITQAMLPKTLGEASAIRTISNYNVEFLLRRVPALADRSFHVIHSSVDVARLEAREPNRDGPFRILYVGSLEVRKGVDSLLRALALAPRLPDWQCRVVGDGPARSRLERLAGQLNLSSHLTFFGAQPFERVAEEFENAQVVVVPSTIGPRGRTEGIPNVIIESLAHQRPVISTAVSGIPELVEDGVTGLLVPPDDPAAIHGALHRIVADYDAALAMAARGRKRVEEQFDLEKNVVAQLRMFEAVSGRGSVTYGGRGCAHYIGGER